MQRGSSSGVVGVESFSLSKKVVSDAVLPSKPSKLHVLRGDWDSVEDALVLLSKEHIYAAPVVDESGEFLGCLSQLDIMSFLLSKFPKLEDRYDDFFASVRSGGTEMMVRCRDAVNFANAQEIAPMVTSTLDMSILFALKLLSSSSVLRIPVLDEAGKKPVGILSQFDLVRYLQKHANHLSVAQKSMQELGLATPNPHPITACPSDITLSVVKKLIDHRLPGIPILDSKGRVAQHFSTSDVKVTVDSFAWLGLPLASAHERHPTAIYSVRPNDTLSNALHVVVKNHVHSIYVLDKDGHFLRLLGLHELLDAFVSGRPESPTCSK